MLTLVGAGDAHLSIERFKANHGGRYDDHAQR